MTDEDCRMNRIEKASFLIDDDIGWIGIAAGLGGLEGRSNKGTTKHYKRGPLRGGSNARTFSASYARVARNLRCTSISCSLLV